MTNTVTTSGVEVIPTKQRAVKVGGQFRTAGHIRAAADALLESGRPFEINTGAMARGYRSVPYPAPEIQRYLASRGASFVLSSDSHSAETLRYGFAKAEAEAAANGLRLMRFSPPHSGA